MADSNYEPDARRDRRYRSYRSLAGSVRLNVRVSRATKERLDALADNGDFTVGMGAVIEKLAAAAEQFLRPQKRQRSRKRNVPQRTN